MHSHEASTGRWLIRKEFWKEIALPSGLREAMNPNWQGRVGTCFSWGWGQRQNKCKGSGAAKQSNCPQDPKRLVVPTVNPSLLAAWKTANTQRREFSVYLLSPGTTSFVAVPFILCWQNYPTWQLHCTTNAHGRLYTTLGDSCHFCHICFIYKQGSELLRPCAYSSLEYLVCSMHFSRHWGCNMN